MTTILKEYGNTEGPLGFPMLDRQARALEALLSTMPKEDAYKYRKAVVLKAATEVSPGERSDVSWISSEAPDRQCDVVLARGMNDSQFKNNPLVTLQHSYYLPPVGKSLWRKVVKDGEYKGVKAKTVYPARPKEWPENQDWMPDQVFTLIKAELLRGKSIGFLPTKVHIPDNKERDKNGWGASEVELVIDEWLLLEYACVYLPAQSNALVEEVSKSLSAEVKKALNIPEREEEAVTLPHVDIKELEREVLARISGPALVELSSQAVSDAVDRIRGRV